MEMLKIEPPNKCRLWHRWQLVRNTGINQYHQCKDCAARKVDSSEFGYQPINYRWVLGQEQTL